MVVDTSALVAIMGDEPERHRFNRLIEAATATDVSVASLLETRIVLFARSGDSAVLALDAFMLRSFPPARGRRGHGRNSGSFSGASHRPEAGVVMEENNGSFSGASHRPEAGVVMGETGVVSQELPTGPRPAWSWQKPG